jgi:phosphoglucomutase
LYGSVWTTTKMASSRLCLRRRLRRPSGTEDIYKIYVESFQGADHPCRTLEEA